MSNEYTFAGRIRRPKDRHPGEEIRMTVGPERTRIGFGSHELGEWPNTALRLGIRPAVMIDIAGEMWEFSVDDPSLFLRVAEARLGDHPSGDLRDLAGSDTGDDAPEVTVEVMEGPPEPDTALGWAGLLRVVSTRRRATSTTIVLSAIAGILVVAAVVVGDFVPTVMATVAGAAAAVALIGWRQIQQRRSTSRDAAAITASADEEARLARALASAFSAPRVPTTRPSEAASLVDHELTMIRGVGPQFARILVRAGIGSIEDLATISPEQRIVVERALGVQNERIDRDRWIEQAAEIVRRRRRGSDRLR